MEIQIRKASITDAHFLLQLRNEPENRQFFFNSEVVRLDEHLLWLNKVLSNSEEFLFIAILGETCVGQIYINCRRRVGISLAIKFKGKGLGFKLIQLASGEYLKINPGDLFAEIKLNNIASVKSFKKAGYQEFQRNPEMIVLKYSGS